MKIVVIYIDFKSLDHNNWFGIILLHREELLQLKKENI